MAGGAAPAYDMARVRFAVLELSHMSVVPFGIMVTWRGGFRAMNLLRSVVLSVMVEAVVWVVWARLDIVISPFVPFRRNSAALGTRTRSSMVSVTLPDVYVAEDITGGVVSVYVTTWVMFTAFGNMEPSGLPVPPGMMVRYRGGIIAIKRSSSVGPGVLDHRSDTTMPRGLRL